MRKNKGSACLAMTRSAIDILLSLAAQTSRGALITLAVVGIGIPMALHALYGRHTPHPVGQVAQVAGMPAAHADPATAKAAVKLISSLHQARRTVG